MRIFKNYETDNWSSILRANKIYCTARGNREIELSCARIAALEWG